MRAIGSAAVRKALILLAVHGALSCASAGAQTAVTTTGGTSGQIPVFTGASTVASSPIAVSGGNIGIGTGTTAPLQPFTVMSSGIYTPVYGGYTGATANALIKLAKSPFLEFIGDGTGNDGPNIGLVQLNIGPTSSTNATYEAASELYLGATRATSASGVGNGTASVVGNTDILGKIGFYGDDGSTLRTRGAVIDAEVYTANQAIGTYTLPAALNLATTGKAPIVFYTNIGGNLMSQFVGSSAERMRVDYNGNVGIGTTNPLSLFSVGSSSQFQVGSTGAVTALSVTASGPIRSSSGGVVFPDGTTQTTAYTQLVSGSNVITEVNGNVGIDAAAPIEPLTVMATESLTPVYLGHSSATANGVVVLGKTPLMELVGDGHANGDPNIGLVQLNIGSTVAGDGTGAYQSAAEVYLAATRAATAAAAGTAQVANTDILGKIGFYGDDGTGTATGMRTRGAVIDAEVDTANGAVSAGTMPAALNLGTTGPAPIVFYTNLGDANLGPYFGSSTEKMRIDYNGNVGIGTTSPGASLEVNGSVKLTAGSAGAVTFADGSVQSTAYIGPQLGSNTIAGGVVASTAALTSQSYVVNPTATGATAHCYKIATLPPNNVADDDHLHLAVNLNYQWGAGANASIDALFGSRGVFTYQYSQRGATITQQAKLAAYQNSDTSVDLYLVFNGTYATASYAVLERTEDTVYASPADLGAATPPGTLVFDSSSASYPPSMFTPFGGNVGLNTTTPAATLDIANGILHVAGATNPATPVQGAYLGWNATGGQGETDFINNPGYGSGGFAFVSVPQSGSPRTTVLQVSPTGALLFADGTTQTTAWTGALCGGDYAESVNAGAGRKRYEPGDVLVIAAGSDADVEKSAEPYSTMVSGVFATKPGLVGRRQTSPKSPDEVPMAMVGIVPTKVSAENGSIRKGDLLVTSSTAGYAMKGTDRGRMLGAVIGKAMGSLDSGEGVIEVLVALQ